MNLGFYFCASLSEVQCSCPHSVNACELVRCGGNGRHVGQVGGEQRGTVVELKAVSSGFQAAWKPATCRGTRVL